MSLEFLLANLNTLIQSKILICDHEINANSTVRIVEDFRSNKIRVDLNIPLKYSEQVQVENAHRTIDEDQRMAIEAAIVRIVKARQTLKHALLMQEVIQQLSSRFRPKIAVIKKCIDILIDKDYLERNPNDRDVLRYLA